MKRPDKLIIATRNENKVNEISKLIKQYFAHIVSLNSLNTDIKIIEDAPSFYENALKKAKAVHNITKAPVLADDSGLCAEALNNAPGIYSARYAGENASDLENNNKLLYELRGKNNRKAFFECSIVLILSHGITIKASGRIYGTIIDKPRGNNGFGYDPIFYLKDHKKTMAELPLHFKNRISHRGRAIKGILEQLRTL